MSDNSTPLRLIQICAAGNFSEPVTTSLIGERPLKARARRVDGGYRVTGRKMFASMLEAADFVLVMAYPDEATSPSAGIILMLPRGTEGRSVDRTGMCSASGT